MSTYRTKITWVGSTGAGLRGYSRDHRAVTEPASADLALSADASFGGDPGRPNPEQLVVVAASSCQLLSFLGAAARAGVDVLGYVDHASSTLDLAADPPRLATVRLEVRITVAAAVEETTVHGLVELAHRQCYIANSLRVPVEITTAVERLAPGDPRSSGGS